jgi:hypothetical protein
MTELERFRNRVFCRRCNNKTNHVIIHKHSIGGEDDDGGFFWSDDYIISQCMGCDTINFIKDYDDVSMHFSIYDENGHGHEHIDIDDITVYPPEPINNKGTENIYHIVEFQHLPEVLGTLYKQVVANFELKHYLLAAAGLRMIIEGICNDLSITKGYVIDDETGKIILDGEGNQVKSSNLNGKINGLVEKGVLTEGQTAILHIIRKLGNQTVHKLNNPKRKIMVSSLEIVEQTFRNIYELQKYDTLAKQFSK